MECPARVLVCILIASSFMSSGLQGCASSVSEERPSKETHTILQRARHFLAAGDYRRAVEACQEEVRFRPSAASYTYLTYVYQAIGGFLEYQAAHDRWVVIEQLVRNLSGDRPELLIDPPDILARMAKELIGESVQRESDVTAAMAARLDQADVARLWRYQRDWRKAHPEDWWHGVPAEWGW